MAGEDDPPVERVALGQLGRELDPSRDVLPRPRPRAADVAARAVLDAPGREAGVTDLDAEMADVDQVVLSPPSSAVHDDDQRERAIAGGKPKVAELLRLRSVDEPRVGGEGRRVVENVMAVPRHAAIIGLLRCARDRPARALAGARGEARL